MAQSKRFEPEGWAASFSGAWRHVVQEVDSPSMIVSMHRPEVDLHALSSMLQKDRYQLVDLDSFHELRLLIGQHPVDLVILDGARHLLESLDCCQRLKADPKHQFIPVMLANMPEEHHLNAIRAGADSCLRAPIHPEVFCSRVQALLRQKHATDRLERAETVLFALAQAVEMRDNLTGGHCERLAVFSLALGMTMGLSREELFTLYRGGYLHDVGKIVLPDSILFCPGKLSPEDWATMQTHTVRGEAICRSLESLAPVLPIIRNHHEKWDGTGYPDGLAGDRIPLLARVLQLADIYDALTSKRPYKAPVPAREAVAIMELEAGLGWRDPEMMRLFLRMHSQSVSRAAEFIHENYGESNVLDLVHLHEAVNGAPVNQLVT